MRLSSTLAAPLVLLLAVGGVEAASYTTSMGAGEVTCLEIRGGGAATPRAIQQAAAMGLPLCEDVDTSVTGSITPRGNTFVVPESLVKQDDAHRN
ncbi:MAG: hypothetical protein EOP19_00455 [Hyphomicrobiales bacterium]|nr:MAG: hypothetical protein EOP19_00455 [Hyphomicrobiales bacterium]